jgi:hypothetical protein
LTTEARERAHSIIAPDHTARFCMASICLVALGAALSPRLATAKCGHFLFAVCLMAKWSENLVLNAHTEDSIRG